MAEDINPIINALKACMG